MGNMRLLLLAGDPGNEFKSGLMDIISLIFTALGILMVLYAVYLFFLMATASDESKRRSAKSRVVKTFASVLIVVALIGMLQGLKITITTPKIDKPIGDNVVIPESPLKNGSISAAMQVSFIKKTVGHGSSVVTYNYTGSLTLTADNVKLPSGYTLIKIRNWHIIPGDTVSAKALAEGTWSEVKESKDKDNWSATFERVAGVNDPLQNKPAPFVIESGDYQFAATVVAQDADGVQEQGLVSGTIKITVVNK